MDFDLQTIEQRVTEILLSDPETRDNDFLLLVYYWTKQAKDKDLILSLKDGKLSPAESITRSRRHLQEHNEILRGEKYKERQKMARDFQLTFFDLWG